MINLLPGDYKLRGHYNRLNTRLIRWLLASLAIIIGLALILGAGWLYLDHQTSNLNHSITTTQQQLADQDLDQVRKKAKEISQNVGIINKVLHREIRFSSLLDEVSRVMPTGTILNSLVLSDKVSGAIDLNVSAKDSSAATQVAVNLGDPKNNLFAKADIISVNCSSQSIDYPCSINLRALFDNKTAERFINAATEASQ